MLALWFSCHHQLALRCGTAGVSEAHQKCPCSVYPEGDRTSIDGLPRRAANCSDIRPDVKHFNFGVKIQDNLRRAGSTHESWGASVQYRERYLEWLCTCVLNYSLMDGLFTDWLVGRHHVKDSVGNE
ncbi:hypothetical protein B0H13DRAFT_1867470 [Mycena leptocephala]|nr:hypothetical protein B0H13DRAFT_1867470 [Mycena leptocephala]